MRRAHGGDGLEALVAADAVVDVDDEVAGGEAGGLGQEVLGALAAAGGADQAVAEDVLLGDDGEAGGLEAVLERPDGEAEAAVAARGRGALAISRASVTPLSARRPARRSRAPAE